MSNGGNTYEYEYGIHLLEPFSLAFAVDDLRSCSSHISRYMWCGWVRAFIIVFPGSLEGLHFIWVTQKYEVYS